MGIILNIIFVTIVLIAMGLFIAFSPVLFAAELAIMTRSKDSSRDIIYFLAGVATPIVLIVLLSYLFVDPTQSINIKSPFKFSDRTIAPFVDLIVGVIFVCTSFFWRKSSRFLSTSQPQKAKKESIVNKITKPYTLYWFGFIKMIMSVTSLATIFLAIRFIKTSIDIEFLQLFALIVLVVTAIMPFLTLAILEKIRPRAFMHVKNASDSMALWDYKKLVANLIFIGGCLLITMSLLKIF